MTEVKLPTSVSEIRGGLTAKESSDPVIDESIERNLSGEGAIVLSIVLLCKSGELGKEWGVALHLPAAWISRRRKLQLCSRTQYRRWTLSHSMLMYTGVIWKHWCISSGFYMKYSVVGRYFCCSLNKTNKASQVQTLSFSCQGKIHGQTSNMSYLTSLKLVTL